MSNTHWLKVWPEFYDDVSSGTKPFEVRIDDRVPQYEAGDTLILAEWDNTDGKYTGRDCEKIATYVLRDDRFVKEGFCIIGMKGPPSDLIRPVRCGECRYYHPDDLNDEICHNVNGLTEPADDDYCSYGERKAAE